jgi:hypothetical protein
MNASGVGLAVSIMLATACFSPSYNEVRCDRSGACPDGLTCDVDGMCRSDVLAIDAQAIDAQSIDAQAADASSVRTVTLSQSSSLVIAADNSLACTQSATGFTAENSYYRAFHLADHGVSTEFAANRIDVAVESAVAGAGTSQTIQVKLYTVAGTFPSGVLTQIAGPDGHGAQHHHRHHHPRHAVAAGSPPPAPPSSPRSTCPTAAPSATRSSSAPTPPPRPARATSAPPTAARRTRSPSRRPATPACTSS